MRATEVSPTLAQRYWSHVDQRGPDECWPWTAYADQGKKKLNYGKIWSGYADGKLIMEYAHRVGWFLVYGDPGDQHVRHTCDNPLCQNPAHWVLGSHQDNMNDMAERGRLVNVRGERHGKTTLTADAVRDIRARRAAGQVYRVIAEVHNITLASAYDICAGRTWSHIT